MNGNMVSWADYHGAGTGDGTFGGQVSAQDLAALNKALTAGSAINNPGQAAGEGFPLRVESLESTLANVTYRMEHVKFWRALPKRPAYNTVEEFNQLVSYGNRSGGGWISEVELPRTTDTTYARKYAQIKFMGVTKHVSLVSTLVKPAHGNVIVAETIAGTMDLLKDIEKNLFFGDSSLDPVQWDGYYTQIVNDAPSTNIIDKRGEPLTEEDLQDAALTIQDAPNYGRGTHLFMNPKHKADLMKIFYPRGRYESFNAPDGGMIGGDIKGFSSMAGDIMFESDVFLEVTPAPPASGSTEPQAPGQPASVTSSVGAASGSLFIASDAGAYNYSVVAVNRYGESAPRALASAATITTAGEGVTLTITPADAKATYYEIYRSPKGGAAGTVKRIGRVANSAGSGTTQFVDLNAVIPNTAPAFLFQLDFDNMHFAQLAPMMKIPIGTVDPSYRWMQLLFGVPILRSPGRNVIFKNVGRAPGYVGAP